MKTEPKTTTIRKNVLINVVVEADLSNMIWCTRHTPLEYQAKELERAVKEFEAFLRDHRSQDMITLDVRREYKDICSSCESPWEEDSDESGTFCVCCGAKVVELE